MAPIQRAPQEVNRILTRLTVEALAAGWNPYALARESGVHYSVLRRWETGQVTNPLLSLLAAVAKPLGLRVDLIAERHVPLMNLTEEEIAALIEAALVGWDSLPVNHPEQGPARSALIKLGKLVTEETVDA